LNSAPESYELLIDTGTAEREKFLDQLEELFVDFRDERTSSINRTYRVVKSMQNWIRSLPNYTKKFTIYLKDGKQKEILPATAFIRRELLKFEINSRELLFDTFVKKLGEDNNGLVGCYQQIYHTKPCFATPSEGFTLCIVLMKTKVRLMRCSIRCLAPIIWIIST